jgi:hypothetical protein
MSLQNADGVKETTTTTGSGTISLLGATTGLRTFVAGVGNGATCPYRIDDGLGTWEETWGTVASGTPDTITRGTLINSSTGSRITFGAGTKTVAIVPMVEMLLTPAASVGLAETSIASATTTDLSTVQTFRALITGTVTITGLGTQPNAIRFLKFAASLVLTYNATSLITPSSANIQTAAGDQCIAVSDASSNWTIVSYTRAATTLTATSAGANPTASLTQQATITLLPGKWRLSGIVYENSGGAGTGQMAIGATTASSAGTTNGRSFLQYSVSATGTGGASMPGFDVTVAANTAYYLNVASSASSPFVYVTLRADPLI